MNPSTFLRLSPGRALVIAGCLLLLAGGFGLRHAYAAVGPFADFPGHWSGTGKIQPQGQATERVRCTANYRTPGSTAHEINLQLGCESDSYNFDLAGQFRVDERNQLSGNWSEQTRNVGGTATGVVRGNHLLIHVESSVFSANMTMVTRGAEQLVTIDTFGGGQRVNASIVLRRGSR